MFAIGNIHSHVDFGVGPSGIDLQDNIKQQLQQPGIFGHENGFMVTLIINKRGDLSARLDVLVDTKQKWFKKPVATFKMNTHVSMPPEPAIEAWVKEQKLKLRPLYSGRGRHGRRYSPIAKDKGLSPVNYFSQQCEGGRNNAIKKRWGIIREMIGRGWTVAMDTRTYGNYQALIVTRACGNNDLAVPFIEKGSINNTKKAATQHKASAIKLLNKGNAVFMDPKNSGTIYYYSDEEGDARGDECARLVFSNAAAFNPDGDDKFILFDEHTHDYPQALTDLLEDIEERRLMGDLGYA